MSLYHIRKYIPAFCEGFPLPVIYNLTYDELLTPDFVQSHNSRDFDHFEIAPYGKELIIDAHYKSGEHWVVAFAVDASTPFADNWRYKSGNISP
jgi:hypothetical protein